MRNGNVSDSSERLFEYKFKIQGIWYNAFRICRKLDSLLIFKAIFLGEIVHTALKTGDSEKRTVHSLQKNWNHHIDIDCPGNFLFFFIYYFNSFLKVDFSITAAVLTLEYVITMLEVNFIIIIIF